MSIQLDNTSKQNHSWILNHFLPRNHRKYATTYSDKKRMLHKHKTHSITCLFETFPTLAETETTNSPLKTQGVRSTSKNCLENTNYIEKRPPPFKWKLAPLIDREQCRTAHYNSIQTKIEVPLREGHEDEGIANDRQEQLVPYHSSTHLPQ